MDPQLNDVAHSHSASKFCFKCVTFFWSTKWALCFSSVTWLQRWWPAPKGLHHKRPRLGVAQRTKSKHIWLPGELSWCAHATVLGIVQRVQNQWPLPSCKPQFDRYTVHTNSQKRCKLVQNTVKCRQLGASKPPRLRDTWHRSPRNHIFCHKSAAFGPCSALTRLATCPGEFTACAKHNASFQTETHWQAAGIHSP